MTSFDYDDIGAAIRKAGGKYRDNAMTMDLLAILGSIYSLLDRTGEEIAGTADDVEKLKGDVEEIREDVDVLKDVTSDEPEG